MYSVSVKLIYYNTGRILILTCMLARNQYYDYSVCTAGGAMVLFASGIIHEV